MERLVPVQKNCTNIGEVAESGRKRTTRNRVNASRSVGSNPTLTAISHDRANLDLILAALHQLLTTFWRAMPTCRHHVDGRIRRHEYTGAIQ